MADIFAGWSRLIASGAEATRTGLRAVDAMNAAHTVIAARTTIIRAAMADPLGADHRELGRMMPEKVSAFSRAGAATVGAWWAGQSAWMGQMHHLGRMATLGRPPSPAELLDLNARFAALALGSIEAATRLGANSLAPVHRQVTANARRLQRRQARRG